MRVLVCIPCLLTGGTEIQTLNLVRALRESGYEVAVAVYFEHSLDMVAEYRCTGARIYLLSPEAIRPAGSRATFTHLYRGLRRAVRDFRPDIAHVQYMTPAALTIGILRLLGVKKILATAHTGADIYTSRGLRTVRFLTKHVLTAFQCITLRAEESFFGNGSARLFDSTLPHHKGNHFTIYNSLPSHIEFSKIQRSFSDGHITIGVVSRLEHIKGMDLVVPAFAKLSENHPNLRLLIVGDGSQRRLMESQARERELGERIEFAGRQRQEGLTGFYDRIDVLWMPSRSEGFGLTAIEGMARGCVPVVAETGGLPEVVTADCGRIHRSGDIEDMAAQTARLIDDIDTLRTVSTLAIQRAKNFTADRYRNSILTLYNEL